MIIKRGLVFSSFLAAILPLTASAEAPNLLTYQGRLEESGSPVTGTRSVEIKLCDAITAGTCTSTGAQGVGVDAGLFKTTFTVPSAVNLQTGDWYLEVVVGAATLSPRERLSSSPYALVSSTASTLVPFPGDTAVRLRNHFLVVEGSNVGIGQENPAAALHIVSETTSSPHVLIASHSIGGYGLVVSTYANVGVGTNNPDMLLDAQSSDNTNIRAKSTAGTAGLLVDRKHGAADANVLWYTDGNLMWRIRMQTLHGDNLRVFDQTNLKNVMSFMQGGNVGIGAEYPDAALHILSETTSDAHVLITSHTTGGYGLVVTTDAKVGIGTLNPQATLDVAGTVSFATMTVSQTVSVVGHYESAGSSPTLTGCGSGGSVVGTDTVGTVTAGVGTYTDCIVNFTSPWSGSPVCVVSHESTQVNIPSVSSTQVTFKINGNWPNGSKANYICFGTQ